MPAGVASLESLAMRIATSEVLHVTNGDSAGNTLRQTALGGTVLPWQDVLNEGPVPAVPPAALREVRATFLSDCGWGSRSAILDELERRDRLVEQAVAERPVVLWFEHDLYDQLQLVQILDLVRELDVDPERLELINVGTFEGRPDFKGLGELSADELETLWPLRRSVTEELVALAGEGWAAFRAPEPTAVESLVGGDTSSLPFLGSAFRRLLQELPSVENGLSRSERQLLEALAGGPQTTVQMFLASGAREAAPFEGDAWVFRRIAELGGGEHPLVEVPGGGAFPQPPPHGDAASFARTALVLTDAGRAVLTGDADRVDLLGLDRWLGGTHLRPDSLWRWDSAAGRVAA
jgi:hypothetical protein